MELDLRAIADNTRKASTEDLLDRVTIYREEMEPAAVDLMEGELARRGLTPHAIARHADSRQEESMTNNDGTIIRCVRCDRPAVSRDWGWFKLWGRVPLFPAVQSYCAEHGPYR